MWCIEATGTKLGEIGKRWKCLLALARCGIERAYAGPDIMLEWLDISDRLVKMNDVSFVKLSVEWKCFSFSLLVPVALFFGRSCGFTLIVYTIFFLPRTTQIKTQYKYIFHSYQVGTFYLLRLLFTWIKSLVVSFWEHFVKTSLVDVSVPWTHILASWKWAVNPFRQIT